MWAKKTIGLLLFVLVFAPGAYAATFNVQLRNATSGGVIADYPVTVKAEKATTGRIPQVIGSTEVKTDDDGYARSHLAAPPGSLLYAEASYRGVNYRSRAVTVLADTSHYDLSVSVYEISDKLDGVSVTSRRTLIQTVNEGMIEIYETLTVQNTGDHTYVGKFNNELDMNQVLFIPMPPGYVLQSFTGYAKPRIRTDGRAIVTQNEVLPGSLEINIRYYIQSDIGSFDLSLYSEKDSQPIEIMTVFFPAGSPWKFSPGHLKMAGSQQVGGKPYTAWKGRPASVTRLKVIGPAYRGGPSIWHASMVLAFMVAGIFVFLSRHYIRAWHMNSEAKRLDKLNERLSAYAPDEGLKGALGIFASAIEGRRKEIDKFIGEE